MRFCVRLICSVIGRPCFYLASYTLTINACSCFSSSPCCFIISAYVPLDMSEKSSIDGRKLCSIS